MSKKRTWIVPFSVVFLIVIIWGIMEWTAKRSPAIQYFILFSIDDLRADRLGCYGNEKNASPFIDKLAQEGAQFCSAFIPFALTLPSHASLLTSLYPSVFDIPLDARVETIASILSKHGFKTAAFTENAWVTEGYGILNGFEQVDDFVKSFDHLQRKTMGYIKRNREENFFLFLHTHYVHKPFSAPKKYFKKFADRSYSGPIKNDEKSVAAFMNRANRGEASVSAEDIQRIFDIYDSKIRYIDDFIRRLVKRLMRLNMIDKTMLIITSDHGQQFFEYGWFGYRSDVSPFSDIVTKVPLIVYCPALHLKRKYEGLVESIDLAPTILEVAAIKAPKIFQGKSLFPILLGKHHQEIKEKKEIFYFMDRFWGVRTKDKKLILDVHQGKANMYDLIEDPDEKIDIYKTHSHNELTKILIDKILKVQEENDALRKKIGVKRVRLARRLGEKPLKFDKNTVFLSTFNGKSFSYLKENSRQVAAVVEVNSSYDKGKHGKALVLEPKGTTFFLIESAIFGRKGAIEFWMKAREKSLERQKIMKMNVKGRKGVVQIHSSVTLGLDKNKEKRFSFQLMKNPEQEDQKAVNFRCKLNWSEWNHILIAWDAKEVFLVVNGKLRSRRNNFFGDFFDLGERSQVELTGENCLVDELRISNSLRLDLFDKRRTLVDERVLEKLKASSHTE